MPSHSTLAEFFRPIAHRGLHNREKGLVENTSGAFSAAIAKDYAIECDLQPASGGIPVVFHDDALGRLIEGSGLIADQSLETLKRYKYKSIDETILSFAEFLELVNGRVPIMVELKSQWGSPDESFLNQIIQQTRAYKGPIVLKSFDPALVAGIRRLGPEIPRGIVARNYSGDGWWTGKLSTLERFNLCHLLRCGPAHPNFISFNIKDLPSAATWTAKNVFKLPLFTWTVRTTAQRAKAARLADAAIFEGYEP